MLSPGDRLATYEVQKRLAVGGMGEVYLCRHRLLERIDAVKVLRPHLVQDQAFRRRFLREALSAARLRHPHIVTVYTADEVDDQLYLAMEYIPGMDLAAIIEKDGPMEPGRLVRVLDQVADALDAAHRAQMTHRDVKPQNVLVEHPGEAKEHAYLADFGLAKSRHALDQNVTQAGQIFGSIGYVSPEQLNGADTDGRCDQYSLACMTFECLTGRLPFTKPNQLAVISAHLTETPPAATSVRSDLPPGVDAVITNGMAKDREDRYATCVEFVEALREAISVPEPVRTPPPPPPPIKVVKQASVPSPEPAAPEPTPAPVPSGPARLSLAVVGGPDSGHIAALADGDHFIGSSAAVRIEDTEMEGTHFAVRISGWNVQIADVTGHNALRINGEAVNGVRVLHPGDIIEAGASLLEVRESAQLAHLNRNIALPDPVTLRDVVQRQPNVVQRGPQHPHAMVVRVGWQPGRPPVPVSVPLGGVSGVALRGEPEPVNELLRWMVTQAIALHDFRDLCLATAVQPIGNDRWTWISTAPHARPGTPPLRGPHTAMNSEGASDLVSRLNDLIEIRRQAASAGPAHHSLVVLPRVLAVIDDRLGAPGADQLTAQGPRLGVHVLRLIAPSAQPPAGCGICVDVEGSARHLVIHIAGRPGGGRTGTADGVSVAFARDLVEAVADAA